MICDICSAKGTGTLVSSDDMRRAVNDNGFDPFALGLANTALGSAMGLDAKQMYEQWKNTIVAGDTSGWNVCPRCASKLQAHLSATSGKEKSPAEPSTAQPPRKEEKKWYEFWK